MCSADAATDNVMCLPNHNCQEQKHEMNEVAGQNICISHNLYFSANVDMQAIIIEQKHIAFVSLQKILSNPGLFIIASQCCMHTIVGI